MSEETGTETVAETLLANNRKILCKKSCKTRGKEDSSVVTKTATKSEMNSYEFAASTPETQRDSVTLTLRKDGFAAYRETNTLRTDATRFQIAMSYGNVLILE